jgi:hypothetical protein
VSRLDRMVVNSIITKADADAKPLTSSQRWALERLAQGKSLRGLAHGITINHLKMKGLIENSDTITDAGRAAIAKAPK